MTPDDVARTRMQPHDRQRAIEHLEAAGVHIEPGMAHIAVGPASLPEGFTEEGVMVDGPWAREYGCGCREVLADGVMTVASDACPRHGQEVVRVGYLTSEADADALRDERDRLLQALEGLADCCTLTSKAQVQAHDRARTAIARARAQREDG